MSTSTLPANITPYKSFTHWKPDLSHLRIWGCQCFVAIPDELCPKAGFKHFEAIFVGYEEVRIGWCVHDLKEKYFFSRDVISNEELSGCLGVSRSLSTPVIDTPSSPLGHLARPRIHTVVGQEFDEVLHLKEFRRAECKHLHLLSAAPVENGGASGCVGVRMDAIASQ